MAIHHSEDEMDQDIEEEMDQEETENVDEGRKKVNISFVLTF